MLTTTQKAITSDWQKVSEGNCTMQSDIAGVMYDVSIGATEPTDAAISVKLNEPTTFAYAEPVWVRLRAKGANNYSRTINIIT